LAASVAANNLISRFRWIICSSLAWNYPM